MLKIACGKDVCERWCAKKLCVCERWCVTKTYVVCDKVGVCEKVVVYDKDGV